MSTEENKAQALRSWEVVNQRKPHLIKEIYPPDFVWHEPERDIPGHEQGKQFVGTYFQAIPDISISVGDAIVEGDQVVTRHTIYGTHRGETEEFWEFSGRRLYLYVRS